MGTKPRIPIIVILALTWAAVADFPVGIEIGPISLSGLMTICVGAGLALFVPVLIYRGAGRSLEPNLDPLSGSAKIVTLGFLTFILWAGLRATHHIGPEGFQNILVYLIFGVGIGVSAAYSSEAIRVHTASLVGWVAIVSTVVFAGTLLLGEPVFGRRSYAFVSLILLAVLIPRRDLVSRVSRYAPFVVFVGIALSGSRTALALALFLMLFLVVRNRRGKRLVASLVLGVLSAIIAYLLVTEFPPIRDRFVDVGDNSVVAGITINTSGRLDFWDLINDSISTDPIFGHGPGSASEVISASYFRVGHPHSDYLRIVHDFGWVGMICFALAFVWMTGAIASRVARTDDPAAWSGLLVAIVLAISAVTDNVVVYPFVMLPAAMVLGQALSVAVKPRLASHMRSRDERLAQ